MEAASSPSGGRIDRRLYETAVMLRRCAIGLRAGDIWVEGTRNYQPLRHLSAEPSRCTAKVAWSSLPFQTDAASLSWRSAARTLDWRLRRFRQAAERRNRLAGVSFDRDRFKMQPMPPISPPEAEALDRQARRLCFRACGSPNSWSRWPSARVPEQHFAIFGPARSMTTRMPILAAILADGSNLGLERMANASDGVSYAQLAWTHNWYLSPENYQARTP
jgi:hypothetical protein